MDEAHDPQEFRSFELRGWERAVPGYEAGFTTLTDQTIPHLIEMAGVRDGDRVLDVACGPGSLARRLARLGASVTAVDLSPNMVGRAASLAEESGLAVEVKVDDAEELSFADNSFDVVLMNYGILHLARPKAALEQGHRVLKPAGRYAFSCWQGPDRVLGFRVVLDALENLGVRVVLPHGPDFFQFSDPDTCLHALQDTGFTNVVTRSVAQTWRLKDGDALFAAFYDGTVRTGGLLHGLSEVHLETVKKEIISTAEARFRRADALEIPMPALVASGTKG